MVVIEIHAIIIKSQTERLSCNEHHIFKILKITTQSRRGFETSDLILRKNTVLLIFLSAFTRPKL
jgi:hypothetical protein